MRITVFAGLCLALAACSRAVSIENHDPRSPEITGLVRVGDGGYQPGATEKFRVAYAVDGAADVHWSASAGQLVTSGDEVSWTLPQADEATLTVSLETKTRLSTSTFRFRLASPQAIVASASGTVDGTGNATGTSCDLAFDGSGTPIIVYRNDTHPGLWYAKWNGSAWQTELVDGMGYEVGGAVDVPVSLALAPDGTPHVAYTLENGQLWYAFRGASGWTRERVDTTTARYDDPTSFVFLALDASRSNRPTVAYFTGNADTVIAVRTGANTWSNTTVSGGATYDTYVGGLAVSGGVAYFGVYESGYRIASYGFGGTTYSMSATFAPTTNYHQPLVLAMDAAGQPMIAASNTLFHVKSSNVTSGAVTMSPFEENPTSVYDLTYANGKPYLALGHATNLEFVSPDANGYWTYTSAGTVDSTLRIGVAVDPSGVAHACFKRNGVITYQ